MNAVQKQKIKATFKYTWPFYIISSVVIVLLLRFIFATVNATPKYKTLTLFVSGQVTDSKKLTNDLLEKYQSKELKSVSSISEEPTVGAYYTKLTVAGYNSADILIIPFSILESAEINCESFALDLDNSLISNYYQNNTFYTQDSVHYGIKLNKEKVKDYMLLPQEDCYMVINALSESIGEYSKSQVKERNTALEVVKEWGM